MSENLFKLTQSKDSRDYTILATNDEVNKFWIIEVIKGSNKETDETNYLVKLTSKADNQEAVFKKEDFEDSNLAKQVFKRMRRIGYVKNSFIRHIENCVNDVIYNQKEKIIQVDDISKYVPVNISKGMTAIHYYKKIIKYIEDNRKLFPKQSSNKYQHEVSEGAILDGKGYRVNKIGRYMLGIRTGVVKRVLNIKTDNEYSDVIKELVYIGAIKADINDYETSRLDKKVRLKIGKEVTVYILDINPTLLEGGNKYESKKVR